MGGLVDRGGKDVSQSDSVVALVGQSGTDVGHWRELGWNRWMPRQMLLGSGSLGS